MGAPAGGAAPIVLTRRLAASAAGEPAPLILELTADERSRLRGLRHSRCGTALLLQLPRGEALQPDEWLATADGRPRVRLAAAPEPLLLVRAATSLELLRAAYHLGNRHVAMEIQAQELRLLDDPVLADLLTRRGLQLERRCEPFRPESGAYAGVGGHSHAHHPSDPNGRDGAHAHSHEASHGHRHDHGDDHGYRQAAAAAGERQQPQEQA